MNDFIENAIAAIMKHVQIVSESAKKKNTKTVYLMGAEHACDVLKTIAGNDVVKVIRCRDCKYFSGANDKENEFTAVGYCNRNPEKPVLPMVYNNYCGFAERKENET